jgi:succinyl-CoA synthetase alpha subunit
MTTEIANLLTVHGLGQSTCVSLGGDTVVGATFVDLLPLYAADPETKAVVFFGEPGGGAEEALADYVATHPSRLPIVAFIAGRFADDMPGVRFGHAAAMVEGNRGSTRGKITALKAAGILVADTFADIVTLLTRHMN